MQKRQLIYFGSAILVLVVLSSWILILQLSRSRTAYVNVTEVYNGFQLKKELEQKLDKTKQARQFLLDSMKVSIDLLAQRLQSKVKVDTNDMNLYYYQREMFLKQQQQFEQDNQVLSDQYTEQIWAQINQYLKDYGETKGYEYIFGASGDGTLMFADKGEDITEDVSGYINERYQGKN